MLPYWPQIEENLQQKRSQTLPKLNALNGHDKTVQDQAGRTCISRKKEACPLEGNCLSKAIVYRAKVMPDTKTETLAVGLAAMEFKARLKTIRYGSTTKQARKTQNLANTPGSLKANSDTSPSNGRSLPRQTLLKSNEAIQFMYDGKALNFHQKGTGNTKQTKRTNFNMQAPTKVYSQIR